MAAADEGMKVALGRKISAQRQPGDCACDRRPATGRRRPGKGARAGAPYSAGNCGITRRRLVHWLAPSVPDSRSVSPPRLHRWTTCPRAALRLLSLRPAPRRRGPIDTARCDGSRMPQSSSHGWLAALAATRRRIDALRHRSQSTPTTPGADAAAAGLLARRMMARATATRRARFREAATSTRPSSCRQALASLPSRARRYAVLRGPRGCAGSLKPRRCGRPSARKRCGGFHRRCPPGARPSP